MTKVIILCFGILILATFLSLFENYQYGENSSDNNSSSIINQHYNSVEDYYNDINIQNLIETTAQSAPDTMFFLCYVIDNQFIYEYQYIYIYNSNINTTRRKYINS